jgi:hypothetical protein
MKTPTGIEQKVAAFFLQKAPAKDIKPTDQNV